VACQTSTAPTPTGMKWTLVSDRRAGAAPVSSVLAATTRPLPSKARTGPPIFLLQSVPDPTRAGRPWRLGLAAPHSSLSPSSSPPPPASKVMPLATRPPAALLSEPTPTFSLAPRLREFRSHESRGGVAVDPCGFSLPRRGNGLDSEAM
jgi:hypothetical protein